MHDEDRELKNDENLSQIAYFLYDESNHPVSTFQPTVKKIIEKRNLVGKTVEQDVVIVLSFQNGERAEYPLRISQIDEIDWQNVDRRCVVNPKNRCAKKFIVEKIRLEISAAPVEECYEIATTGIKQIGEDIIFAAGDRVITRSSQPNFSGKCELRSNFHLDINEDISLEEAIRGMIELIRLNSEVGKFLVAHAVSGIIRRAFVEAGITPCGLLVVVGKSGMLKSHYVPHMVQLYNRNKDIAPNTRFNSSPRFIEDIISEFNECTFVLDDLHTTGNKSIQRRNEDTAEEILRRISDNIGRGHKEGKDSVQKSFGCNVIYIGEYYYGLESSIPRVLVVEVEKKIDGNIFDKYQRKMPLLVSTFYYYFIQWYVDHYRDIVETIDGRLAIHRKNVQEAEKLHGRLNDTKFYLQISFMLLLKFVYGAGNVSQEDMRDTYEAFCNSLDILIRKQCERLNSDLNNNSPEPVNYLKVIRKLYRRGRFRLAESAEKFDEKKYDGLIHDNCLYIRRGRLKEIIQTAVPNYVQQELLDSLRNQSAIKQGNEKKGDKVKIKNTVQVSELDGMRFYAIYLHKLE